MEQRVPRRIASLIINALKGGVVPRVGLETITVGRTREIESLLHDLSIVADGGATMRFIVGKYGSGKSFLLQTIRNYAAARGFVVADADLSPERRFTGSKGQGLATYRELIRTLSVRSKPDGGALPLILEKWISGIQLDVAAATDPDDPAFNRQVEQRIFALTGQLEGMVNGFDFARAIIAYWRAYQSDDPATKSNVLKWFRGEYASRAEARAELGINWIVSDDTWYDFLKILAAFMVGAGYTGLIILIDELVNLFKIPHSVTRQNNYEKLLTIYNDVLQGKARHIGFLLGSTPQSVEDRYKGLFSYEALRSRLAESRFAEENRQDLTAPMIRLTMLTQDELFVLCEKLRDMHAQLYDYAPRLDSDDLVRFLTVEFSRVGADTHITPREIIRDFIELLGILHQNPGQTVAQVLGGEELTLAAGTATDDELQQEFAGIDF